MSVSPEGDPLWNAKRVCEFLSVSDRWLRRALAAGRFPEPDVRLNRRTGLRWRQGTIEEYIEDRSNPGIQGGAA